MLYGLECDASKWVQQIQWLRRAKTMMVMKWREMMKINGKNFIFTKTIEKNDNKTSFSLFSNEKNPLCMLTRKMKSKTHDVICAVCVCVFVDGRHSIEGGLEFWLLVAESAVSRHQALYSFSINSHCVYEKGTQTNPTDHISSQFSTSSLSVRCALLHSFLYSFRNIAEFS